jgi:transposase
MSWNKWPVNIRHHIVRSSVPKLFSLPARGGKIRRLENVWTYPARLSQNGENAFSMNVLTAFTIGLDAGAPAIFPPQLVMEIKALACELPRQLGLPFSRFSNQDIAQEAIRRRLVASISGTTVWRWLSTDSIRPWFYRSWIWPRDPHFTEKAGRVLDLYHRMWRDKPLGSDDYVICADEKTSIQAREPLIDSVPPGSGRLRREEFEYKRKGALAYLAAWDVHHAKLFGLCMPKTGITSFHHLVHLVMTQEPYCSAHRVFWITDNGPSHRGQPAVERMAEWYANALQVHTPIHASWLNQIEIYFSILQRKVLSPNDFSNLKELEKQILDFQLYYEITAKPFEWKFTKEDLNKILKKLSAKESSKRKAA